MTSFLKDVKLTVLFVATAVLISGCFFDSNVSISTSGNEESEFITVFISTNTQTRICDQVSANSFECTYFVTDPFTEGTDIYESSISFEELFFELFILDPLIIQVPDSAAAFSGSYFNNDTMSGGSLIITSGLHTIPADANRSLTAEPGTQFVIIELPPGAAVGDNYSSYSFNLNFQVPPSTTSIDVKPIFTARVELGDGSVYYPPLLPCISNVASTPSITIPIPVPGDTLTLPSFDTSLGCTNETYDFGDGTQPIPTLSLWPLLGLAVLMIIVAAARLAKPKRR